MMKEVKNKKRLKFGHTRLFASIVILVGNLFLLVNCNPGGEDTPETVGTIEGRITDVIDGEPISDATVSLTGPETRSETVGSDGLYRFENVVVGTHTVVASHPQYESNSVEVSLKPLEATEGDLALSPIISLDVSPATLDFSTAINQLNLNLNNTGDTELTFEIESEDQWLVLRQTSGVLRPKTQDVLTVQIDRSRMDVGDFEGNIIVNVPGRGSKNIKVLASKLSNSLAVLTLSDGALNFGMGLTNRSLQIKNNGNSTLIWNITKSDDWLSTSEVDGSIPPGNSQNITVFVDRTNLADGEYDGKLSFDSNGGSANVSIQIKVNSSNPDPNNIVVTSALQAYYTFDDGTLTDLVDNFRAINFGVIFSDDIPNTEGESILLDGIENFIQLAGNPMRNTSPKTIHATVNLWMKSSGPNGTLVAIPFRGNDAHNRFILGFSLGKVIHSASSNCSTGNRFGDFEIDISSALFNGEWHMLTTTYNGNTKNVTLFLDGARLAVDTYEIGSPQFCPSLILDAENLRIGFGFQENGTISLEKYSGLLDNIRIYNRPLSSSEVEEIFEAKQ